MAKINLYLNFDGNCEEAFMFYAGVFKTSVTGTYRYGDMPADPNMPDLSEENKKKVLHTSIAMNENTILMGADVVEGFGGKLIQGNSTYIMVDVASVEEAKTYFEALSKEAKVLEMNLDETFFAERFASLQDKYGIFWMIHFEGNKKM